jgi:hypothetical protein
VPDLGNAELTVCSHHFFFRSFLGLVWSLSSLVVLTMNRLGRNVDTSKGKGQFGDAGMMAMVQHSFNNSTFALRATMVITVLCALLAFISFITYAVFSDSLNAFVAFVVMCTALVHVAVIASDVILVLARNEIPVSAMAKDICWVFGLFLVFVIHVAFTVQAIMAG